MTDAAGVSGNLVNILTGKVEFQEGMSIFAATGLIPEHDAFQQVPTRQKVLMPIFDEKGRLLAPSDTETKRIMEDIFTASQNLPQGSLPQSYVYLMELTGNMSWTAEPMFYYTKSNAERLRMAAKDFGIELRLSYFDALDQQVLSLKHPLNPQQSKELYLKVFKSVYKSNELELSRFKECLEGGIFRLFTSDKIPVGNKLRGEKP